MPNLERIDPQDQINILRRMMERKRLKNTQSDNGDDFCDTKSNEEYTIDAVSNIMESRPGELRTEEGNSIRDRLPFIWRFENEINRELLIKNKSTIQEYRNTTDGNIFIEYKYIDNSKVLDDPTKKKWLKLENQSTGEIVLWNGTYTIIKKFWYTHNRIAIQRWAKENGGMRYSLSYTFIDIISDNTGKPLISEQK